MKQFLASRKAKGFTLVELLIVIIIIGILAGMLLLAVGSATDKAEATKVINALRNYKSASLMYYTDHNFWPAPGGDNWTDSLDAYTDRSLDTTAFTQVVIISGDNDRVLIGLDAAAGSPLAQGAVQGKLANQAAASALFQADRAPYQGGNQVFMPMR